MNEVADLKERMKDFWALGNYPEVAKRFVPAAEKLVAACDIGVGDRVLDVAAGDGNVAVAAAQTGARVTASDFTPRLLAAGRERTEALGLEVRWEEADAEALPYPDGMFDAVTSAFGLMFAPRPEVATAEAFRVTAPGGVVGLTAWTPDGFTGQITALMGEYLPVPMGTDRPIDWGIETTVRKRLEPHASALEVTRDRIVWEFDSVPATLAWQERNFGALIAARHSLPSKEYTSLLTRIAELIRQWNHATDGSVRLPAAYLLAIGRHDR
ncbi:class I SAM-dependent methyltransferase [Conexibacter woesei]|uniref:class I SAM-dependent methyltransferase n=1 Tax=Conexibacter woesei TaxID=191495 RepID=UPI000417C239|nr:methyltransferase domain-containing protein [Conexibacter woesei]